MGRALRIEYPSGLYHVMSQENVMWLIYNKVKYLILFKEISFKLNIKIKSVYSQMNYIFINNIREDKKRGGRILTFNDFKKR